MHAAKTIRLVSDFYAGKSVLVTGGTGFLGKVIIEKLVYSCRDVDKVYVLIRDKKGVCSVDRMRQILDKPLFSRLKAERPEDLKKIVPVTGDITYKNLVLRDEDFRTLKEKVSIVIHSAATTKFNEPLKVAMRVNVEGTRNVLDLCHQLRNIEAFVHVSTVYSNVQNKIIEEKILPSPATVEEVYKFEEQFGQDEKKVSKFLGERPNAYTFTKAIAENIVATSHGRIPTAIIRPSAVTPSLKEPLVGWVDNAYGTTMIQMQVAKGYLRFLLGKSAGILDIVPVDIVTNATLVVAAKGTSAGKVQVYNSCSSSCNPITMTKLFNTYADESRKHKSNLIPYPGIVMIPNKLIVQALQTLCRGIACGADSWRLLLGKEPIHSRLVKEAIAVQIAVEYFTSRTWEVKCERTRALYNSLQPSDKQVFPFDPVPIDWDQHVREYFRGVNQFVLTPTHNRHPKHKL